MAIKNNLTEFSTILILRDTPETRSAFGAPIDENARLTATFGSTEVTNPYYLKLIDESFTGKGWRTKYPFLTTALQSGALTPGVDGSTTNLWANAVRNNILQSIGADVSITLGYNNAPSTAGTGIIVDDIFYVGNTQTVSYSGIVSNNTDVTVSGSFTGVANGTKVILSTVGTTELSTSTVYYVYSANGTSCKLSNSSSSYVAIDDFDGSAGSGTAYLAPATFDYVSPTTFAVPTPALGVGDFLFWGDDASSLNIGGKIEEVYASGTAEHNMGKRYKFAKNTKDSFPEDGGNIIPQNIYYYRKNWNGKDVKNNTQVNSNEIGGGFYVLIRIEPDNSGAHLRYPYFGQDNPAENYAVSKLVDSTTPEQYIFLEHLRIRKISNTFNNQETVDDLFAGELIPCTMHRTSNFYFDGANNNPTNGRLASLWGGDNIQYPSICPEWCAYYVNPYGGSGKKLDKNSVYVLEINERLPAVPSGDMPTKQSFYNFAINGSI